MTKQRSEEAMERLDFNAAGRVWRDIQNGRLPRYREV